MPSEWRVGMLHYPIKAPDMLSRALQMNNYSVDHECIDLEVRVMSAMHTTDENSYKLK